MVLLTREPGRGDDTAQKGVPSGIMSYGTNTGDNARTKDDALSAEKRTVLEVRR